MEKVICRKCHKEFMTNNCKEKLCERCKVSKACKIRNAIAVVIPTLAVFSSGKFLKYKKASK